MVGHVLKADPEETGFPHAQQAEMARLGAEGVSDAPHAPDTAAAPLLGEAAPPDSRAVGGCVALHFAGGGAWCRADVLAYDDVREVLTSGVQGF